MKINWVEYENTQTGLKVNRMAFNELTLLVGLSGTGKSTILNIVRLFQNVADRKYSKDMAHTVMKTGFEIDGTGYEWNIEFGAELGEDKVIVLEERLSINGEDYQAMKIPGLSQTMSRVNIFENDESIKRLTDEFARVFIYSAHSQNLVPAAPLPQEVFEQNVAGLKTRNNPYLSLCIAHERDKELFDEIKQTYYSIFDTVEDIYFELDTGVNAYVLYQTEKGVSSPIRYERLSSGMYKTLMLLTGLFTFPEGSVMVIDEFENSFGANCIDEVVEVIKEFEDKFQFIITSHHPYIINNIPTDNWSVVGRKGTQISSKSAKDFGIGATKHEAFLELINLWRYDENIHFDRGQ